MSKSSSSYNFTKAEEKQNKLNSSFRTLKEQNYSYNNNEQHVNFQNLIRSIRDEHGGMEMQKMHRYLFWLIEEFRKQQSRDADLPGANKTNSVVSNETGSRNKTEDCPRISNVARECFRRNGKYLETGIDYQNLIREMRNEPGRWKVEEWHGYLNMLIEEFRKQPSQNEDLLIPNGTNSVVPKVEQTPIQEDDKSVENVAGI